MPNDDRDDPWQATLATRLRAHYGTEPRPSEPPAELRADWLARLVALRTVVDDAQGRYREAGTIDRGGMGTVTEAFDAALGRVVAKKKATAHGRADGAGDARRQLRLLAEATIVGGLQHPGIVPVHDVGIDGDGAPFFVMSRIEGRSMAAILADPARAEWPLVRIVEVLRRVCETMAYAHSRGVAHRDLKPANVMVGTFGEVYVVDWGLARGEPASADDGAGDERTRPLDLTATGTVLGTPAYLPPERVVAAASAADNETRAAIQADVYAVGAMLYEVLSGRPPYVCEQERWSLTAILEAIRRGPPRPLPQVAPDCDRELAAVCARAMRREPAARYRDMAALADDLRAWSEHRVVAAHGAGPARRLHKWLRRNRVLAWTSTAALAVLVTVSVAFVVRLAAARDAAQANLREILDLAVVQRVSDLRERADAELWPAEAARVPQMVAWLEEANGLRPTLERLRARRSTLDIRGRDDGEAEVEAAWRRRLLDEAVAALESFFAPAPTEPALPLASSVAAVEARITATRTLTRDSLESDDARTRWQAAADVARAGGRYGDLELRPQPGLLPLGPDPASGLLEFAHLQSGAPATRDSSGALRCGPDTGVVMVLLPGGDFFMGAVADGPHNVDPLAETINEGPVHRVHLAPFLLSKFEMTQSQWTRVTGSNPSVHQASSIYVDDDLAWRHPVESVDWWQARRVLHALGLALPTEAQWEYAARAGTETPWYAGAHLEDLLRPPAGNLADASSAAALGVQGWMPTPGLQDGFVMHAPVGSFPPNGFGLFDMLGNVWEWCDDEYVSYATPADPRTGARPRTADPTTVMYRGGAFDQPAQEARSANRAGGPPTRQHFSLGLRPACAWR